MLNFNSLKKKLLYKKNNDFLSTSKSIFFVFLNNSSFKPFKKDLQDLGYEIRFLVVDTCLASLWKNIRSLITLVIV